MRDGDLLGRTLAAVVRDRIGLAAGLADYEREMTTYGFGVLAGAVGTGRARMAQDPLMA